MGKGRGRKARGWPGNRRSRRASSLLPGIDSPWVRFCLLFTLLSVAIYSLISWTPESRLVFANAATAWSLAAALRLVGLDSAVQGVVVSAGGFAVSIVPECTVLFAAGLFAAFVASYPASPRDRLLGILIGIPALFVVNTARLQAIFVAGWMKREWFDFIHVYLGQIMTVAFVFLACRAWLRFVRGRDAGSEQLREMGWFWLRFLGVSAVLFIAWMMLNRHYVGGIDQVLLWAFHMAGRDLQITRQLDLYYPTFSVVNFVALVASTRFLEARDKWKSLALGLGILFLLHLAHRACNVFLIAYRMPAFDHWAVIIRTFAQYLLPILFWLYWTRPKADFGTQAAALRDETRVPLADRRF